MIKGSLKDRMTFKFPDEWEIRTLSDITTDIIDNRGKTPPLDKDGKYPLLEIFNMQEGSLSLITQEKQKYVNEEVYQTWFRNGHPFHGDILISTVGNVGIVSYYDKENASIAQNIVALRLNRDKAHSKFLAYFLSSVQFEKWIKGVTMHAVQPSLKVPHLLEGPVPLPLLNEQQKIASILASVDEAIEKTELILKKSEKITNSVTKKLLTSGIDHEVLKSTRLGELPNNWEVIALKELASINMGQSPPSVDVHDYEKGIPFYQGNADFGEMNPSPRKWCDKPKKIANSNDILFSVRAPVGEMNIAIEECCIGRGLASITPREVSPSFLYYLLLFYRKDLKRAAQGSTFTAINKNDLVNLELPLPKKEEQEKITIILDTLWNKKQIELSKLNELKNLKKGLMQQLLTGKVRVPTTESEEGPQ